MVVVAVVGVLALLATVAYRRWVRTSYVLEAQNMIANIRAAEESFRAENGGYLNVSKGLGPGNDYPATTPGNFKTSWPSPGSMCGVCSSPKVTWSSLNIQSSAPVLFGYSLVAQNSGAPPALTVNGAGVDLTALTAPWYIVEADGDQDGNNVFTKVYGMSGTNRILIDNEGE
jgi:Tfp pilus assembly protein PilE